MSSRVILSNIRRSLRLLDYSHLASDLPFTLKHNKICVRHSSSKSLSIKGKLGIYLDKLKAEYDLASQKLFTSGLPDNDVELYKKIQMKNEHIVRAYNEYLGNFNDIEELEKLMNGALRFFFWS